MLASKQTGEGHRYNQYTAPEGRMVPQTSQVYARGLIRLEKLGV